MLIRTSCRRCGATVTSESHALGERELKALSEHLGVCARIAPAERSPCDRPLGEMLRYFEIEIVLGGA